MYKQYSWCTSSSQVSEVRCGVCRLDVPVGVDVCAAAPCHELWVSVQVACHGIPVQEALVSTPLGAVDGYLNAVVWNALLNAQVRVKDLSQDAALLFTVWSPDRGGRIHGMTTLRLFDENGRLKAGKQKLLLYMQDLEDLLGDEYDAAATSAAGAVGHLCKLRPGTAARVDDPRYVLAHAVGERYEQFAEVDQMFRMEKHLEEFHHRALFCEDHDGKSSAAAAVGGSHGGSGSAKGSGGSPSHHKARNGGANGVGGGRSATTWLDVMTLKRVQQLYEEAAHRGRQHSRGRRDTSTEAGNDDPASAVLPPPVLSPTEAELQSLFCLVVELPLQPHPVLYDERAYPAVLPHAPPRTLAHMVPMGCIVVKERDRDRGHRDGDAAAGASGTDKRRLAAEAGAPPAPNAVASASRGDVIAAAVERGRWASPSAAQPSPYPAAPVPSDGTGTGATLSPPPPGAAPERTGTILEFCISGPVGPGAASASSAAGGPAQPPFNGSCLRVIADWDMDVENLAEQQYRCLAHDTLRATADPTAKPNVEEKERIDRVVNAAGTNLKYADKDLLYRFRYFLTENKKALTKFLLSVDWSVESEVVEVPILLAQWKAKAPIDISDALRLLGHERAFQAPVVRQYAVETLKKASDEDLLTFLLQLVQALRYEPPVTGDDDSSVGYPDRRLGASSDDDWGGDASASASASASHASAAASAFSSSFTWAGITLSSSALATLGVTTAPAKGDGYAAGGASEKRLSRRTGQEPVIIGHHGAGLVSPLAQYLIDRACASPIVANFLYWYLKVETEDEGPHGALFKQIFDSFLIQLASSTAAVATDGTAAGVGHGADTSDVPRETIVQGAECAVQLYALNEYMDKIFECHNEARAVSGRKDAKQAHLRKLLAARSLQAVPGHIESVPLPLNPRLQIVTLSPDSATMFASAVYPCVIEFRCLASPTGTAISRTAAAAVHAAAAAAHAAPAAAAAASGPAAESAAATGHVDDDDDDDRYRVVISGESDGGDVDAADGTVSPTDSAAAAVAAGVAGGATGPVLPAGPQATCVKLMFKSGDDLRQDQLIMQMISLMDGLLRKVNLDLRVLTYGILAVGPNDGIMEFVPGAMAISAILKEFKTISNFLRHHNPDKSGPYEISAGAIDTFVKSCAASCVISYILGIGDRHLDNIMIKANGQLFHIDFGFIFGQDPKPVPPPPFRFTRHMADAMGGEDSEHYERFKVYCCQAFNWLRKSANLILNLLSLMGDAGIVDISKRSDLPKVLAKVEEKFRLDLTDERAEVYFVGLINESLHAIAPRLMEIAHQIAVARR